MKVRVRIAIYGLLAVAIWLTWIIVQQDHVLGQQQQLIRQLSATGRI